MTFLDLPTEDQEDIPAGPEDTYFNQQYKVGHFIIECI